MLRVKTTEYKKQSMNFQIQGAEKVTITLQNKENPIYYR